MDFFWKSHQPRFEMNLKLIRFYFSSSGIVTVILILKVILNKEFGISREKKLYEVPIDHKTSNRLFFEQNTIVSIVPDWRNWKFCYSDLRKTKPACGFVSTSACMTWQTKVWKIAITVLQTNTPRRSCRNI